MEIKMILGITIFLISFYYIITEKIPVTWVSLLGGTFMIITGIITKEQGITAIADNLHIILLLVAMMIMVNLISETGFFQWVALKMAVKVKIEPIRLLISFGIITAILSAFLDNVTTVLLVIPVIMAITKELGIDAKAYILLVIISSNIGGAATLIGDPPNLIISTEGRLSFNDFFIYSTPLAIINMIIITFLFIKVFKKDLVVSDELKERMLKIDTNEVVADWPQLKKALVVFTIVILSFVFEGIHHRGLENVALVGALYLSIRMKKNPHEVFQELEWEMIFFLIGLFLLVKGVEELKILNSLGKYMIFMAKDNVYLVSIIILWLSSFSTIFVGSISHAVTFSHIVTAIEPNYNSKILWWALSYGTCYGGVGTLIASACNLIGVNEAKKRGTILSAREYIKYGFSVMMITGVVNSIFLYLIS